MKVLLAPDSFKGSLAASEFCEIAAGSIRAVNPAIEIIRMPMSDGGEGLAEILMTTLGGQHRRVAATDPCGRRIEAGYVHLVDQSTAIIDFASASGLTRVEADQRNPLTATSLGTGQLMLAALEAGCSRLLVGLGGSATIDGGLGALSALGFEFRDRRGQLLKPGGDELNRLHHIDQSRLTPLALNARIDLLCDVTAPLLGPNGASYLYGPQKGADQGALARLETGLASLAAVMEEQFENCRGLSLQPGSGAAGGAGLGFAGLLGARIHNGFEYVASLSDLEKTFIDTSPDLVITGEGCIDQQTLQGKVVQGVAAAAARAGVHCVAVGGQVKAGSEPLLSAGLSTMIALATDEASLEELIQQVEARLDRAIRSILKGFPGAVEQDGNID